MKQFLFSGIAIILLFNCSGTRPANLGVKDNRLLQCPNYPNCVCSFDTDKQHGISPLTYQGSLEAAKAKLLQVINSMKRTAIIENKNDYIYAEFKSALWGFVDDVEFYFDDQHKVINVRSASRLGKGDLGVNRDRIETIRTKFIELSNK